MARSFSGSGQYFSVVAAAVTAAPLTLACWGYTSTFTTAQVMIGITRGSGGGGSTDVFDLIHRGDLAGDFLNARTVAAGTSQAAGTDSAPASATWFHGAAVFSSAASRMCYINGVAGSGDANSLTPTGINATNIAANRTNAGAFTGAWNGRLAHAAIYSAALNADDVGQLAAGYCPLLVRPSALVGYWPLYARGLVAEEDWAGGNALTKTGSPAFIDEPRIIYPTRRRVFLPAAAAAAFNPAWAASANSVIQPGALAA